MPILAELQRRFGDAIVETHEQHGDVTAVVARDALLTVLAHCRDDAALARMMAIAGNTKPSMLQDLEHGRATEVDVVNGGVAQRGSEHAIATPFNDRVIELVHAMERGDRSPAPEELTELVAVARS